jgi:hypothetical protein
VSRPISGIWKFDEGIRLLELAQKAGALFRKRTVLGGKKPVARLRTIELDVEARLAYSRIPSTF